MVSGQGGSSVGFNFNPIDAVKDVAGGIGDLAEGGAKAFEGAIDVAKKASISDIGHTVLDVAGMVPVVGEAADLANAGWYAAEGDFANAALSGAAAIPFAGNVATGAKWVKRGVEVADHVSDGVKAVDHVADVTKTTERVVDGGKVAPPPPGKGGGPGGPKGPETPGGGPNGPDLNGIAYRKDLPQHLKGPDGFKGTKLNGTHNQDVAIAEVKAKGFDPTVKPTGTKGINEVEWKVPDPNNPGETITRSKTTYDPKVFDDQTMLDMAQGAGEQGWAKHLNGEQGPFPIVQDGVNFTVHINKDPATGASYIGNVHPVP